ncbi:Bug family tripartite tricarboxylate transporter substrate binding protein [Cupriavidus sp. NPDC089707]|uniref:Bug family tripartite tricarboxylate transporter substrate binding protein n=1 Tax=Cupriavidus sp. NPDC089707 TaxID=3363963 RepID=UPI0037F2785B
MHRRAFSTLAAATLALIALPAASEPAFPVKPVRLVVPFAPGGPVDVMARILGDQMARSMGTPVVVENRPGAGGNIGSAAVAKAPPDGYTLLLTPGSILTINEVIYPRLQFDPARDFVPVSLTGDMPLVIAVNPTVPAMTVKELVAYAGKRGGLVLSSPGNGTTPHLAAELFRRETGIQLVHVPFKSGAESAAAIISGQVMGGIETPPSVLPHVQAGKLRALAVAGPSRLEALPDVPTTAEAGLHSVRIVSWFGLVAPAGTPADVVQKLNAEVARAIKNPEVKARYARLGIRPVSSTPAEMTRLAQGERAMWHKVVKDAGIRLE